jgi:hypothetical protein
MHIQGAIPCKITLLGTLVMSKQVKCPDTTAALDPSENTTTDLMCSFWSDISIS